MTHLVVGDGGDDGGRPQDPGLGAVQLVVDVALEPAQDKRRLELTRVLHMLQARLRGDDLDLQHLTHTQRKHSGNITAQKKRGMNE